MDITRGCVVLSTAGHDKGGLFYVLSIDETGYAFIIDGKTRKFEKPKRKKLKHLKFYTIETQSRIYEKIINDNRPENAEIRKALGLLTKEVSEWQKTE